MYGMLIRKKSIMKKKKKNKIVINNKTWLIISIIYFVFIVSYALLFHESWRDEAQSFLIVRDLNLVELFKQLSYEGHPPLWYLIVMPFAKLGFPYQIQIVLSCFFVSLANYLLLTKAPFKNWVKILLLLAAPSYSYAVVARSYSLIPLAVYLIAINYKDRHKNKMKYAFSLLFLLNIHILALGFVAALFIQFGIEELIIIKKDKKELKSFIKVFLVSCFFVFSLFIILYGGTKENVLVVIGSNDLVPTTDIYQFLIRHIFFEFYSSLVLVTSFIGYTIYNGIKDKNIKELIVLFVGVLWVAFVFVFIYFGNHQKSLIIFFIFIFYFWITYKNKSRKKIIDIMILLILIENILVGYALLQRDFTNNFSNSKDAAEYIEKNTSDGSVFVPTNVYPVSGIIPFTNNKKFWNPYSKKYYTFVVQDIYTKYDYSCSEMIDIINNNFDNTDNVYIIVIPDIEAIHYEDNIRTYSKCEKEGIITRVYASKEESIIRDEFFIVYKINEDKVIK